MTDLLLRDRTGDSRPDSLTRTLTFDLPAPWLLHGLFRSGAYISHTGGVATVEVALATDDGYAVGTVVPSDGVPPGERGFDEFFSGGPTRPADKASVTFRADVHDPEAVAPAVIAAAERAAEIRETVEHGETA